MRRAARGPLVAIGLLAVLAAGCDSGGASTTTATGTAPPSSTSVPVRLRITYEPHGTAVGRRRWTLTCAPTGGDHPRRAAACAELVAHPHALAPARRACRYAAVRGAPEALVVGTDRGVAVRRGFRPGCDPEWATLHALLRGR